MCPHIPATNAPHWRENEESKIRAAGESIDRSAQPMGHGQEKAVMQINLPFIIGASSRRREILRRTLPALTIGYTISNQLLKLKPNVHRNRIALCVNPSEPLLPVRQHTLCRSLANENCTRPRQGRAEPTFWWGWCGQVTANRLV